MEVMLKKLRKELTNYTQAQMAEQVGVKARTYESWERNQAMLSLAQACACADVLGCTVDEIAGRPVPTDVPLPAARRLNAEGMRRLEEHAADLAGNPAYRRGSQQGAGDQVPYADSA